MMEYLDERFPHPPLLPVYPVARANARMFSHRIEKEWTPLIRTIESAKRNNKRSPSAAKELKEQLVAVAPIFEEMPYFMSEEFSLVDCTVAPILWRLPHLGVELPPKQTRGLQDYQYRMFNRDAFQASLSEAEREMPRT
jgi:RNA polymerase-associated protein